jgi:ATP-dependent DNA ligase
MPAGEVSFGFTGEDREMLNGRLHSHVASKPFVMCSGKANWLKPGLFCQVSFLERRSSGTLRDAVFERLIEC